MAPENESVFENDVEKVEDVLQQGCSRLSVDAGTKQVPLLPTGTLQKQEAEEMSREQFSEAEVVNRTQAGDQSKSTNVNQAHKASSHVCWECNENWENCTHRKLLLSSPAKATTAKQPSKDCSAERQVAVHNPQPFKDCNSGCGICETTEAGEVEVVPESPLSDAYCDACSPDACDSQDQNQGCVGKSPSFEKESELESPMDVDNCKNSCQGSEADEDLSPLLEEQEDMSKAKASSRSSQFRKADASMDFKKSQDSSWRGEGTPFSPHLDGIDNPIKEGVLGTKSSPVGLSECKGAKHCGRKDSKITAHFMRVPRTEEKR